MMSRVREFKDVSPVFWIVFPILSMTAFCLIGYFSPESIQQWINEEFGLIENLQVFFLGFTVFYGIKLIQLRSLPNGCWLRIGIGLGVFAIVFALAEELSWGQAYFAWDTPEFFHKFNDQGETNFHNSTSWLDQKPRALLELFVILGGIVSPVWMWIRSRKGKEIKEGIKEFLPTWVCFPSALLAELSILPDRLGGLTGTRMGLYGLRLSELQEYFFYLLILAYLHSLYIRMLRNKVLVSSP